MNKYVMTQSICHPIPDVWMNEALSPALKIHPVETLTENDKTEVSDFLKARPVAEFTGIHRSLNKAGYKNSDYCQTIFV